MKLPAIGMRMRIIAPLGKVGQLYQVRAHVDGQVVMRTWSRAKQRWMYIIESRYAFELGTYKPVERKKKSRNDQTGT